jgi:phosphoribosyl 1,2-cyclic phosphodiesterase
MAVTVLPLSSGSTGNATLVSCGTTRVLVDAGLSCKGLAERLEAVGVDPRSITCVLLSHEHQDHARGMERFSTKYQVPVACDPAVLEALDLSYVHLAAWMPLLPGRRLELGSVTVDAFPVPHDARRPLAFVLEAEGLRVGVATDLGHATTLVLERLRGCHALLLESNHDDLMLRDGPYPWSLKQRVGGRLGHLSNDEMAALLRHVVDERCQSVILAHLSEQNNTPALAAAAARRALRQAPKTRLAIAESDRPSPPVVL